MFSRSCQYALQAVLYIAVHTQNKKMIGVKEIAKSQNIPLHFLSKILQKMVKGKILNSIKGPNGGFALNILPEKLTLLLIVEIIDGLDVFDLCGFGMKTCSDLSPCPIHHDYKIVKNKVRQLLVKKTVAQLCQDVEEGKSIVTFKTL